MDVKVSVIIPVYNAEKYLRQCMDSVINQSLEDIQIICVDDGSTDSSLDILNSYKVNDVRIQIITQKNQYAGVARNNGLKYAEGKYVIFWDADDFFEKNALEELYNRAEETDADIVVCNSYAYDDEFGCDMDWGLSVDEKDIVQGSIFSSEKYKDSIFNIFDASVWNKLFNRKFVYHYSLKFRKSAVAEDINFVFIGLALARKIVYVNERLIHYRKYNGNSLENSKADTWQYTISMFDDFFEELSKRNLISTFRRSFDNFIVEHFVAVLSMLGDYNAYIEMCDTIREKVVVKYELDKHDNTYYYSDYNYRRMNKLLSCSSKDYLMYDLAQRRNYEERNYVYYRMLNKGVEEYYNNILEKNAYYLRQKIWFFPYSSIPKKSNVVIYGAGDVGRDYYRQIKESEYCNIVLWVDRNYKEVKLEGLPVESCDRINETFYDYIIIATVEQVIHDSIVRDLIHMGIDKEKIIWSGEN